MLALDDEKLQSLAPDEVLQYLFEQALQDDEDLTAKKIFKNEQADAMTQPENGLQEVFTFS